MFDAVKERDRIIEWIKDWFEVNGNGCNAIIGISGGKDSTIVAALCKEALGADRVIGVRIPNGIQHDIADSVEVCKYLGIKGLEINIEWPYYHIMKQVKEQVGDASAQTEQNLPPRLRMSTLYAVAQSMNGRVANTCNLSETLIGWETRWGDAVGDFSPLADYTATEVIEIGKTLDIPKHLVEKAPSDGLCGKTDEDAFGFTYKQLDSYIRDGSSGDGEIDKSIQRKIDRSAFKRRPIPKCVYVPSYIPESI